MRVEVRGLGFSYRARGARVVPVLGDLDLDVADGSVHAIVGPNGCGKTTLLRLVAGLETPGAGRVDILGERRHENLTAVVFQTPRLLPWWDVGRNVAIGAEFSGKERSLYRRLREFHTAQVGLRGLADRHPDTLSLGQQTMAGLGRAFAHDAEVLLLDEPFAHLDPLLPRKLHEEFETHWQLDPRTTVIVTHDVAEAVTLADRVSVMAAGPGPLVATVEVDVERPRTAVDPAHPGLRAALRHVWDALERGAR